MESKVTEDVDVESDTGQAYSKPTYVYLVRLGDTYGSTVYHATLDFPLAFKLAESLVNAQTDPYQPSSWTIPNEVALWELTTSRHTGREYGYISIEKWDLE